jgi:hypothetical protein
MNTRGKIACAVSLLIGVSAPGLARAQAANVASFLNMANQMNNEEQDEAKELRSKAGDNQVLVTMADTLTQDHKPMSRRWSPWPSKRTSAWILTKPIKSSRIGWIT